jgi:enamine deaminase RidA (YjgF/YER057c/UK114 family)
MLNRQAHVSEDRVASLLTPKRECQCCTMGNGVCHGEVIVMTTTQSQEVFVRCGPMIEEGTPREQASKFYGCLPRLLERAGAKMSDVILERVFFRDIAADYEDFQAIRRAAYEEVGVTGDRLPAASYIDQPPCRTGQAYEMQVQAIVPNGSGEVRVESFPELEPRITKKVVQIGEHRHLYIMNIHGARPDGTVSPDFREQSDTMFAKTVPLLAQHGITFPDVLRTWCYLDDIDRDYHEFNLSRNAFFETHNVRRLPASTGIRAGLYPREVLCSFDLYALLDREGVEIEVMHTPTLNEADEYGSSFSRGMKVVLPEKTLLFISGTASVDERGETVHLNDVRRQVERMLLNVRELLRPHGAKFSDVAQVITYLKRSSYLQTFRDVWKDWGLDGLPNSFVEAGVCRPNLLCELEAIVILPT